MPPIIKTDRKKIVNAAVDIIENDGLDALSARTVAAKLAISTQPIYREFGDMDGLRKAATERGYELFWEYIKGDALDQAVKYVMFASEHKNLFRFLFGEAGNSYDGLDDLSHKLIPSTDIIDRLAVITGLPRERVYRLHLYIWMAMNGVAYYALGNNIALDVDELKSFTIDLTKALSAFYKEKDDVRT